MMDCIKKLPGVDGEMNLSKNAKKMFIEQVNKIGCCLVGQSKEIAYADKKLYSFAAMTNIVSIS